MALTRLLVAGFRNIQHAELMLDSKVNLFCGPNGAGKTSLLEAVHMLATGRSFRSRQHRSVIQHSSRGLTVFAELETGYSLGIERLTDGSGRARINQRPAESSSQLASCLPLQLINSNSFDVLDGGPGVRRRLLDWTVFHVEPMFAREWKNYQIALRQRNALLRRGKIAVDAITVWEEQLAHSGERVNILREGRFQEFQSAVSALLCELPGGLPGPVEIGYRRGWRKETDLCTALQESREGDVSLGHTRIGPHRADVRFTLAGEPAQNILSRGQQKMLVCAVRTAMAELVSRHRTQPVFLVDDLPAELDETNQQVFAHWISRSASQVLVTGIEESTTIRPWQRLEAPWNHPRVFHVEHGNISAEPSAAL
ncbi:DNA replication/repair protein RecF [Microbulbifer sp. 2205BS26-8]|uniref:DNA replication/repair protein RecF n=1 Tax=Microbulbifer sp. 2205BS26-8 TaxID=3064386 RepID=UPI00273DE45E|nr:DNA replication/repair protein RecF [Microbulbifer sp. 2205BS26-8]MDP5210686.1 DNA replication/repair protein RecF [Microbulbifer sp. 2205BS26-8]